MDKPMLPRLAAACGIVFPITMFLAAGDGSHFVAWRAVAATWALVLFLPFLGYLYSVLRDAEGDRGWLATTALAAGLMGVIVKIASHAPEIAIHHEHLVKGTPLYKALDDSAAGATVVSLYPLAICCAAVAMVALREQLMPRWFGIFAAITAAALAVNGAFLFASFVPAFLLFLLWTLVTGVVLFRRSTSAVPRVAYST